MPSEEVVYVANNAEEFDDYFLNLALQHSKFGLEFIRNVSSNNLQVPKSGGSDVDENAQNLFAELVKLTSPMVYEVLKHRSADKFTEWRQNADVYALWTELHSIDEEVVKQYTIDKIKNKKSDCKHYSLISALLSLVSGDYIVASWSDNRDSSDLASDIVDLNTNLGIIGALIITMAFPMFQDASFDENSWMCIAYILLSGVCGVLESCSVLLCIRNIVVLNLVETENIHDFVIVANKYLIAPVKLNIIAIVCLVLALAIFAFWQYDKITAWIFVAAITAPAIILFFYYTACGIQALYQVQPWDNKKILKVTGSGKRKSRFGAKRISGSDGGNTVQVAVHPAGDK